MLDALWDLVWAGEVTNDTFAPLRALRWKRTGSGATGVRERPADRLGPPEAAGRWSLVRAVRARGDATERLHAQSLALLERHGVLTREAVASEGIDGGFSGVYPVLRAMEEAGRIRRGYFVDGLGAAQFALAGALDRLRADRDRAEGLAGSCLPAGRDGSGQPVRRRAAMAASWRGGSTAAPAAAGAYVAIVDGAAAIYLERGGSTLQTLGRPTTRRPRRPRPAPRGRWWRTAAREVVIRKVDGLPVGESPGATRLLGAGFAPGYRGLVAGRQMTVG